jgi:hypothetical protein
MTITKLITLLEKKFPNAWFKEGAEFSNSTSGSVWTGEGSMIGDEEMFNYFGSGDTYKFGAHIKLCNFVEKNGYYVECYDAGTYMIYPI